VTLQTDRQDWLVGSKWLGGIQTECSDMRLRIRQWVEEAMDELSPTNPVHIHLNDLIPDLGIDPRVVLPRLRAPYEDVIAALGARLADVMPSLILPLKCAETLVCGWPDVRKPDFDFAGERPSIYLVDRREGIWLWRGERYRVALTGYTPFEPALEDIVFFYQTLRDEAAREEDWEYARSIHGEHYPRSLRPR
jgi:hypothetical protein